MCNAKLGHAQIWLITLLDNTLFVNLSAENYPRSIRFVDKNFVTCQRNYNIFGFFVRLFSLQKRFILIQLPIKYYFISASIYSKIINPVAVSMRSQQETLILRDECRIEMTNKWATFFGDFFSPLFTESGTASHAQNYLNGRCMSTRWCSRPADTLYLS